MVMHEVLKDTEEGCT